MAACQFLGQVQGSYHGVNVRKEGMEHGVVQDIGADSGRAHPFQAALERGQPMGPVGMCWCSFFGEQGIQLLAQVRGQQSGQLSGELLLDGAKGFGDQAGQR